jgi:uncharacterized protein YjiS (DUF1127 family)
MSWLSITKGDLSPTMLAAESAAELRTQAVVTAKRTWRRGLSPLLALLAKAMLEYRLRQAARDLAQLDDRTLKDIGLTRWAIEDAVRSNRMTSLHALGPEWDVLNGSGQSASRRR